MIYKVQCKFVHLYSILKNKVYADQIILKVKRIRDQSQRIKLWQRTSVINNKILICSYFGGGCLILNMSKIMCIIKILLKKIITILKIFYAFLNFFIILYHKNIHN